MSSYKTLLNNTFYTSELDFIEIKQRGEMLKILKMRIYKNLNGCNKSKEIGRAHV